MSERVDVPLRQPHMYIFILPYQLMPSVAELEHQVDTLCTDVAVQQKIADRLRSSLDATRSLLDSAVVEVWQYQCVSITATVTLAHSVSR